MPAWMCVDSIWGPEQNGRRTLGDSWTTAKDKPHTMKKQQTAPAEEIAAVLAAAFMKRAEIQADAAEQQAFDERFRQRQRRAAWLLLIAAVLIVLAWATIPVRATEFNVRSAAPFVVKSAKPAAAKTAAGQHSHRCPVDGTIWTHGEDQFGKDVSHRCPKCGRLEWDVYQTQAKPPAFISAGGCPGGICPTPAKRGRR